MLHAVMIPVFDQLDAVATFMGFLQNENDSVGASFCRLEQEHWEISKGTTRLIWPKRGILYP